MTKRLSLSTLLIGLSALLVAPHAQAETQNPNYTVVVFPALCGIACVGDDPLGLEATGFRSMWTNQTALVDGGHIMPWDFSSTTFRPGRVYTVNTELIPPAPNSVAPIFGRTRDFEIHAHFEAIRAWVEKAAAETDELIIVGHSFSAPGVVWALTTTAQAGVHDKVKAVVTVAGPLAGQDFAGSIACGGYSKAFCSLDPAGAAIAELRMLTLFGINAPTIDLGRKLVGVASEALLSGTAGDGAVFVSSQLYMTNSWMFYRDQLPAMDPNYLAIFYETLPYAWNSHSYVNTGVAMRAAARWLDDRQLGGQHFCNAQSCEIYEGDCDNHAQCAGALRCMSDVGPNYGWSATTDVCEPRSNGALDYCSAEFRCSEGEGRCDSDSECRSGLVCSGWFGVNYCRRPINIPPRR